MKNSLSQKYREALNMFVGDDILRPALSGPFINEDYAVATDAHVLLIFKANLLEKIDFVSHEKAPNALRVIPIDQIGLREVFATSELRALLDKSNAKFAEKYERKTIDCEDCQGMGEVSFTYNDVFGESHDLDHECPVCEGHTRIDVIIEVDGNRKYRDGEFCEIQEIIKLRNSYFNAQLFERVVDCAELLEVEELVLTSQYSEYSATKFEVGEAHVMIMPVKVPETKKHTITEFTRESSSDLIIHKIEENEN
jgi:hypothetical protein